MTENEKMDPQTPGTPGELSPASTSPVTPLPEAAADNARTEETADAGRVAAESAADDSKIEEPRAAETAADDSKLEEPVAAEIAADDSTIEEPVDAETAAREAEEAALAEMNARMQWYIIHTYSGFENKVKESLRQRADAYGMGDKIGEILVPTEEVVEIRDGKKYHVKKKFFPGYVLVQMEMSDEAWHAVRSTPKVTGFVGGGQRPLPMGREEIDRILSQVHVTKDKPKPKFNYRVGEVVKITDGPFSNFSGTVEEINEDRSTLKVMVSIFGRATPVELEFHQVKRSD